MKLRNFIRRVSTVLLKKWKDMVMLIAGVGLVETGQLVEDHLPHSFLLLSVAHIWNRGATGSNKLNTILSQFMLFLLLVMEGNIRKLLPPCPVNLISKPRVVRIQLRAIRQNLISKLVKILDLPGEPGNSLSIILYIIEKMYKGTKGFRSHLIVSSDDLEVA